MRSAASHRSRGTLRLAPSIDQLLAAVSEVANGVERWIGERRAGARPQTEVRPAAEPEAEATDEESAQLIRISLPAIQTHPQPAEIPAAPTSGNVWLTEIRALAALAAPVVAQALTAQLLNIVDLLLVGTLLETRDLAAAALATMVFNLVQVLLAGASVALDAACAGAVATAQPSHLGLYVQRSILLICVLVLLVAAALHNSEHFLKLVVGVDAELSATAASYCQGLMLGLLPLGISTALSRYLGAQAVLWPPIAVDVIANILNVTLNAMMIEVDGYMGAALATSTARVAQLVLMLGLLWRIRSTLAAKGTWTGWNWRGAVLDPTAGGMRTMAAATAAAVLVCAAESGPLELSNALAAQLGVPALCAHTVILQTCIFISLGVPLGFGTAASARVPQLLQAGDAVGAQRTAITVVACTLAYNLFCAFLLLLSRHHLGIFFTRDDEVARACAAVALVAALYQLVDGCAIAVAGVLRGLGGKDRALTAVLFTGTAVVALPLARALGLTQAGGLPGLWYGLLIGAGAILLFLLGWLKGVDWAAEARKAAAASAVTASDTAEQQEQQVAAS